MYTTDDLLCVLYAYWSGNVTQYEWLRSLYLVAHGPNGTDTTRRWLGGRYVYRELVSPEEARGI